MSSKFLDFITGMIYSQPMSFYTNVLQYGNSLLVRYVEDGKRLTKRVKYEPTLFDLVTTGQRTGYTTLDGRAVLPHSSTPSERQKIGLRIERTKRLSLVTRSIRIVGYQTSIPAVSIGIWTRCSWSLSILRWSARTGFRNQRTHWNLCCPLRSRTINPSGLWCSVCTILRTVAMM